jgi:transposase InsO family protein
VTPEAEETQVTKKQRKTKPEEAIRKKGQVPYEVRVRIVQAVMRGTKFADTAVAFGVSTAVIQKFMALFHAGGMEALRPLRHDGGRETKLKKKQAAVSAAERHVLEVRTANPTWGTRRIRDVLARLEGLGVSESSVRRILHEAGLIGEQPAAPAREHPVRRFERAEPNQLWQTDIFQFELRRHQTVYMVGFMDDYSRYIVSWAMAHHHKSSLVIDALERGIAEYGEPKEVLTDQGRQYVAWRGETEFQQLLQRRGIKHAKSRAQHPETLGKIERFWKTLWNEFLKKTVFADFADCLRRVELFIQHYNFQRTNQALDGLVPADRFFRAAPHVRAAVETQIKANSLRLAQEKEPHKPFYLVGRLGDQDLSIAATGGALRVQVGDAAQTIQMNKEHDDATKTTRAFPDDEAPTQTQVPEALAARGALRAPASALATQLREGRATHEGSEEINDGAQTRRGELATDETDSTANGAQAWRAALAERSRGFGSGRSAANADDPIGPLGTYAGHDGDHRARHLTSAVLPARDEGPDRDDASAGAWIERSIESRRRDADAEDRRARGEDLAARAGDPALGAPALLREEGAAAGTGRDAGEAGEEARPSLDERWARTFAWLEETGDDDTAEPIDFDPDDGWRERAMTWNRKLAGADAPIDGDLHGESAGPQRTVDVREPTERAAGAKEALRLDSGSDRRTHDDQRGGEGARHRASEHADAGASSRGSDGGRASATSDGSDSDFGDGEEAASARRATGEGECEAAQAADGIGRHDDGSGRDHPEPAGPPAGILEDLIIALEALAAETAEQRRRAGAGTSDASSPPSSAGAPEEEPT